MAGIPLFLLKKMDLDEATAGFPDPGGFPISFVFFIKFETEHNCL